MASSFYAANAFAKGASQVQRTQAEVLLRNIHRNRDCWFGRQYGFRHIHSIDDYRRQVPLSTYDELRPAIERICAGEQRVLTTERVLLLEPTSGTANVEKLIPFTKSLQREFQAAIRTWIHDLYRNCPLAKSGRAYWSISPLSQIQRTTPGGIPIGFADDAAYLSTWEQGIVRRTMAVPPEVALVQQVRESRALTLYYLLQAEDLSLISVWSPTFLTQLLRQMWDDPEQLLDSIERGGLQLAVEPGRIFTPGKLRRNPDRAGRLREIFQSTASNADKLQEIWPQLSVVSCWADGVSAIYAANLQRELPHVKLQPKGLLATEAFVSLPLVPCCSAASDYRSHFFEFLPSNSKTPQAGDTLLASELEPGQQYEVVVTTGGGLYRYRLFDQVEVVGHHFQVPLLRFLGRGNSTSDLVGEKLTEPQVATAIQSALRESGCQSSFVSLCPLIGPPARYQLLISDSSQPFSPDRIDRLQKQLEKQLQENPGYRYARELNQLCSAEVHVVHSSQCDSWAEYEAGCLAKGQKLGDIKASLLSNRSAI